MSEQGEIHDPALEQIRSAMKREFGHNWIGHIARFQSYWVAYGIHEVRLLHFDLHGALVIARPIYQVEGSHE